MLLLLTLACGSSEPVVAKEPAPVEAATSEGRVFGDWPLCEPSGLLALDDGAVLVVDNEGKPAKKNEAGVPTLWVASVDGGAPVAPARQEAPRDVEAVARAGDELWIVGSLSRNKSCEVKANRWAIHVAAPSAFTAAGLDALQPRRVLERGRDEIGVIEGSVEGCRRVLFGGSTDADAVCAAIVKAAASPEGRACDALNVEGALVVGDRLWVGLRAPLVDGKAVLARLSDNSSLSFDAVRYLDLGGLGVRELAVEGDRLYGIAGTVGDGGKADRSKLFSAPLAGLDTGELPVTVHDDGLPTSAESFLLRPKDVVYLVDGATSDRAPCERPATLLARPR